MTKIDILNFLRKQNRNSRKNLVFKNSSFGSYAKMITNDNSDN